MIALALAAASLLAIELPPRIGVTRETKITLNEVVQRVLANDKDLVVSRILREEAVLNLRGARGVYDPRLGLTGHNLRAVTPVSSSLGGAANGKLTTKELLADPSLSGVTYTGGTYRLDFSSARTQTDSTFATLNPQYPSSVNLNLTQPLWRGLFFDENRHRVQVAKKNIQLSDEQLRQRVIDVVTQSIQAYRELQFAQRNLEVQLEAVRLAEQQDASNRRQVDQGLLAPVDVVQTRTQIATFEQSVFTAQTALTQAENALKALMLADRNDLLWGAALVPDALPESRPEIPALADAVKQALATRTELKTSALSIEVNQLDSRLNRELARPQVDAVATLTVAGLAGRQFVNSGPNPFTAAFGPLVSQINALSVAAGLPPLGPLSFGTSSVPAFLVGGYAKSLDTLTSTQFTTAQVGVNISLPIRNRTANAASAVSAAEGRRLQALRVQTELLIEQDVRNSLQLISSSQQRLDSAIRARQAAEEQYASEQRQFQAGTTTVFLVLQRQTELTAARTREARALADLAESSASLDRATARTLEAQNIKLQ